MNGRADWLAGLARLGADDLRRISRLVDLLATVDRPSADLARSMLAAAPEPATHEEARVRCEAVIAALEQAQADDVQCGIAWWNALTDERRAYWCRQAESARPIDAWRAYRASISAGLDQHRADAWDAAQAEIEP